MTARPIVLIAALWGAALGAPSAAARAGKSADAPVAVTATAEGARVEVALAAAGPAPKIFTLPAPKPRIVLDFAGPLGVAPGVPQTGAGPGAGPIAGFRFAEREGGARRLVLDLSGPATFAAPRLDDLGDGGAVLTLEVMAEAATDKAMAPPAEPNRPRQVVVIDPGHGGKDPGAVGVSGALEKDVNLAAGLALRDALERRGLRVVMTRDGDRFLELEERLQIAREAGADLFISLHSDAAKNPSASGASIYTLSDKGGARARNLAQRRNWELDLETPPVDPAAHGVLVALSQREMRNRSADFAQGVIEALSPVTPMLSNTHRDAGFYVLLAPDVPAVLLEMGFMTNPADERRLTDPKARKAMMGALAAAVDAHFAPRQTHAANAAGAGAGETSPAAP